MFTIEKHKIQNGGRVFFIAEAGVNHNGSIDLAFKLIEEARAAGADAIKFQSFKAEAISTGSAPKSTYHIETTGSDHEQTWFELLKSQELSLEMHEQIKSHCDRIGITFLSTPYDNDSADLLEKLGVGGFKLASTDLNNTPFLRHIARKKLPMIISTAMSNMEEVKEAVATIQSQGLDKIAVLQCTGNYPSKPEDTNMNVMLTYSKELNVVSGYSDHTTGICNPIMATTIGAAIIEKHFTLDKSLPGPDHRMSVNPIELKQTIDAVRQAEVSLGSPKKVVLKSEVENRAKLRKSIVAEQDIIEGQIIEKGMLAIKRPGTGIEPSFLDKLEGSAIATKSIKRDTVIEWDMVDSAIKKT